MILVFEYPESDLGRANRMKNILLGGSVIKIEISKNKDADYQELRNYFVSHPKLKKFIPPVIQDSDSIERLLLFITSERNTYEKWSEFICSNLNDLFKHIELNRRLPSEENICNFLDYKFDSDIIRREWHKAIERMSSDPKGAITLARTILESVCKHILDKKGKGYEKTGGNIRKLYNLTATELNLHPDQHAEKVFKTILESGTTIVTKIGELRNVCGDAHGTGSESVKPSACHAEFAVNLAGITALFLIQTYKAKEPDEPSKEPDKFSTEQIEIMKRLAAREEFGKARIDDVELADLLCMEVVYLKCCIQPLVDDRYVNEDDSSSSFIYSIAPKGKQYLFGNELYARYH